MAVPNIATFSMQDVKTELATSSNDLVYFFSIADNSKFDPNYVGVKNGLLNFRNYGFGKTATLFLSSIASYSGSIGACAGIDDFIARYWMHDIGTPIPIAGDIIYTDSDATTTFNGNNRYYKVDQGGVKRSVQISSTGVVLYVVNCL